MSWLGTERPDDVGALVGHKVRDPFDELAERHLGPSAVVVPEPLVAVVATCRTMSSSVVSDATRTAPLT
jgi:hypothetical protein